MLLSTNVNLKDYQIRTIHETNHDVRNTYIPLEVFDRASIGYQTLEHLYLNHIITTTFGKYADAQISLTKALLEERKAEVDREDIKVNVHKERSNS